MESPQSTPDAAAEIAVGIDLGTTYSSVAFLDAANRPVSIENGSGEILTPSAIFLEQDEIIVGRTAVRGSTVAPENYAEYFKRDMGRPAFHRQIGGRQVPPEVFSALVLAQLKQDAQERLGPLRKAVITVPAYFDEVRRKATQDACRMAGWEVLDIINEPTAAAVCCGWQRGLFGPESAETHKLAERVLVYDLGGGTFDVSVLEIGETTFRTIATDGDVQLGGKDFDERLVDHVAERFLETHGLDPRSDPRDATQLWHDARNLKHDLTECEEASIVCSHAGIRMQLDVSRRKFEDLTQDLLERTRDTADLVLRQAGFDWSKIDRVLTVGGSTRMPMVIQMLRHLTGRDPDQSISADEGVAHGAALYAGMLVGRDHVAGGKLSCELINVNSHSLGVVGVNERSGQRVNAIIIPRNTPIPARAVKSFRTLHEGQENVAVPVVEGESERPEFCVALGKCVIYDLPPELPKGSKVEVEYRYASNGRLFVVARVPSTGLSTGAVIERSHPAVEEDLAAWRDRLLGRQREPSEPPPIPAAAGGEVMAVDPPDRLIIIERLDALYARIGRIAAAASVPQRCAASRRAARDAMEKLQRARQLTAEATQRRQSAVGTAETVQLAAELSQARLAEQQAAKVSGFAYLVLGRECADAGFCPPGSEKDLAEVQRLRERLE